VTVRLLGELELVGPGGEPVDFRRTLASHGVALLEPQRIDLERRVLETTVVVDGSAHTIRIEEPRERIASVARLTPSRSRSVDQRLLAVARHVLRLDEDLTAFYAAAAGDPALAWAISGAGRMLRSPTVFEDVVKTICTTNCAWSATVRMTHALVTELGAVAADGRRAFPSPEAMASCGTAFYAEVARTGYRGAYLLRLAEEVAEGKLDLEALADPELPDELVEERLLALPGVGPYAAAHVMLTALGRYGRLILDSWTRPTYAKLAGRRRTSDSVIERRFRRYGAYAGLAFWLYLTEDWVEA
jgi:3-methyladenine DNA glycosylase/8-oxoguanine DNA glycosylase